MLGSCDVISHFSLILQVVKFLSSKVQLKASTRKTKTQDFFSWLFFIDTHKVFALLRLSLKNVEFNCLEKQFVLSNGSIVPQLSGSSINLFFCRFCQIKFAVELVFFRAAWSATIRSKFLSYGPRFDPLCSLDIHKDL